MLFCSVVVVVVLVFLMAAANDEYQAVTAFTYYNTSEKKEGNCEWFDARCLYLCQIDNMITVADFTTPNCLVNVERAGKMSISICSLFARMAVSEFLLGISLSGFQTFCCCWYYCCWMKRNFSNIIIKTIKVLLPSIVYILPCVRAWVCACVRYE